MADAPAIGLSLAAKRPAPLVQRIPDVVGSYCVPHLQGGREVAVTVDLGAASGATVA